MVRFLSLPAWSERWVPRCDVSCTFHSGLWRLSCPFVGTPKQAVLPRSGFWWHIQPCFGCSWLHATAREGKGRSTSQFHSMSCFVLVKSAVWLNISWMFGHFRWIAIRIYFHFIRSGTWLLHLPLYGINSPFWSRIVARQSRNPSAIVWRRLLFTDISSTLESRVGGSGVRISLWILWCSYCACSLGLAIRLDSSSIEHEQRSNVAAETERNSRAASAERSGAASASFKATSSVDDIPQRNRHICGQPKYIHFVAERLRNDYCYICYTVIALNNTTKSVRRKYNCKTIKWY